MTTDERLERLDRKLDDLLRMVARLAQQPTGRTDQPQAVHDADGGMFLPGTGWLGSNEPGDEDNP